jgi:DNA-binding PadR family transcriptional regulator
MPKENTTKFIVLGLLSHEPMSGYDMKRRLDLTVSHFWPVGFGQIYPTLSGLATSGLIDRFMTTSDKGPQKQVYAITAAGKQALALWLSEPESHEYTKYEILLKLFFGSSGDIAHQMERISEFQARHCVNLDMMRLFAAELEGIREDNPDHLYFYLTALFGQCVYEAYIRWAKLATDLLAEKAAKNSEVTE